MGEARELAERVWSAVEEGEISRLAELFAEDAEVSTSAGQGRGAVYATQLFTRHRSGYPDLRHQVVDAIESADGTAVAQRIVFTATHLGELRGPFGAVPPTGRTLTWRTSDHVRSKNGRIVSWHAHFDRLTLLEQLGQLPPAATRTPNGSDASGPAAGQAPSWRKAVIRRILAEVFGQGRLEVLDELLADDFVNHRVPPGMDSGIGSVRRIVEMERAAFPDLTYTVEREVEEGDVVMALTLAEGTHDGAIFGVPPTGRRVSWRQVHIGRMRDGRMAEPWGVSDLASLWVQIGRAEPIPRVRPVG
jgi:predicted ester cyclase